MRSGWRSSNTVELRRFRTESGARDMLARLLKRFPKNDYAVLRDPKVAL